ncbi:MAG: NUMOD4 domain-containing protein [Christensenellales bacterium]|jgi:hypothetical protein
MFEKVCITQEVWRDIPKYENKYQISSFGRLRNSAGLIMKPMVATNGYLVACLWKKGKQKKKLIHRLVAKAFLCNPNNHKEINHIDEDKTNNRVDNLEWCSRKYNMNYGSVGEKISKSNRGKKASEQTRLKISENSKNRIWINNGKIEKLIKKENKKEYSQWDRGRLAKGGI